MKRLTVFLFPWLFLAGMCAPQPAYAQRDTTPDYGCCGFHDWATYGSDNLLKYHPTADFMGGVALDIIMRGPWIAKSFRKHWYARLGLAAVGAGYWQFQNLKEIHGYRWDYAAYDFSATVLSAALTDAFIVHVLKR